MLHSLLVHVCVVSCPGMRVFSCLYVRACVCAGSSTNDLMCMADGDMVWNFCTIEVLT